MARSKKPFDNADFLGVVPVPAPTKNILPVSVPTKKTSSTEASKDSSAPVGKTDAAGSTYDITNSTNDDTNSIDDDAAANQANRNSSTDVDNKNI